MYQGNNVPKDVTLSTVKCDPSIKFVDWNPTGVKVGLNYYPIKILKSDIFQPLRSACMISNTTANTKNSTSKQSKPTTPSGPHNSNPSNT